MMARLKGVAFPGSLLYTFVGRKGGSMQKNKILIIDDDIELSRTLRAVLEK